MNFPIKVEEAEKTKTLANFQSVNTSMGIKVFRYDTVFVSKNGPGEVIGLVYMMNPGDARPQSDILFEKLINTEYTTPKPVLTEPDTTMNKVMNFIEDAYKDNGKKLPEVFTIQVENLFNIREKSSDDAKRFAKRLGGCENNIMFKHRQLEARYPFVWLAWGKDDMGQAVNDLWVKYPNAIAVNKLNHKGKVYNVQYPVHPLYMKREYFLEAAKGKIF